MSVDARAAIPPAHVFGYREQPSVQKVDSLGFRRIESNTYDYVDIRLEAHRTIMMDAKYGEN